MGPTSLQTPWQQPVPSVAPHAPPKQKGCGHENLQSSKGADFLCFAVWWFEYHRVGQFEADCLAVFFFVSPKGPDLLVGGTRVLGKPFGQGAVFVIRGKCFLFHTVEQTLVGGVSHY